MNQIRVIITGSTGMVGKGVLLECLDHPAVAEVLVINRRPLGMQHPKLNEIIHADFYNLAPIAAQLRGYDACYFCLGTSAFRMKEADYHRITYDLTLHLAHTLLPLNPGLVFCYVSGQGTDSTEMGGSMWARVKGKTENALLRIPFKAAYMFRPGAIEALRGVKSGTKLYNTLYVVFQALFPVMRAFFPNSLTTTVKIGKAMINVTRFGYEKQILDPVDINKLAEMEK